MDRVGYLIEKLNLEPLDIEGGRFSVAFRSPKVIDTLDKRGKRIAVSGIFFLLTKGEVSRLHRVKSDEIWHFYEGAPVELFIVEEKSLTLKRVVLGDVSENTLPMAFVPANSWQCARSLGEYSFVGCNVAPGFEYSDFELPDEKTIEKIIKLYPDLKDFA